MKRRTRAAAAVLALGTWTASCATERAAVFPTRAEDEVIRRPPGVVADPSTHLPAAEPSGSSGRTLVALAEPVDTDQAMQVVRRFFEAVTGEQLERLSELFEASGRMWSGRQQRQLSLEAAWARRLDQLDYTALASSVIFRESDLEVYSASEAQALADTRGLPVVPQEREVLVRVSIVAPSVGQDRLFGDQVVFLLRPAGGGYKISQMREDFRLP